MEENKNDRNMVINITTNNCHYYGICDKKGAIITWMRELFLRALVSRIVFHRVESLQKFVEFNKYFSFWDEGATKTVTFILCFLSYY